MKLLLQRYGVPAATEQQRITVAATAAVALHAVIILGIGFAALPGFQAERVLSLNVALVEHISGELDAAPGGVLMPNTPTQPEVTVPEPLIVPPRNSAPDPVSTHPAEMATQQQPTILTSRNDDESIIQPQPVEPSELTALPMPAAQPSLPPMNDSLTVATQASTTKTGEAGLHLATLDIAPNRPASSPREKYIEVFDSSTLEGFYAENWRLRVERIGMLNFPHEVRQQKLVGRLTLDVAIRSDGTIHSIKMLHSSGYQILDRAARRIVYMAGPFEPFPPELQRRYDILHIVRTWEFDQDNRLGSNP
jgi:protein TonB